ncbi:MULTISPECIES: hypothetical protein [Pseudomonas]|uniref:hypothetical protein n=1 Tax=Pseudomonas TaxID=286 RepID=UPI0006488509|nr:MULTISPECIES: hypothetical protein [Pseudomonas]MQB17458.1 hypothetical protein [Pseudomonas lactis]OOV90919.1 hypothetical protein MF6394_29425 [Pseudomonas sp. MF6394]
MSGISGVNSNATIYTKAMEDIAKTAGDVGGSSSAAARAEAVAEKTFAETMKARLIAGLYTAAKEIRS